MISEIALDFGGGAMVWLACDEPGATEVQERAWSYQPGKYRLHARGYATERCFEGYYQESKVDRARLKVR